MFLGSFYLDVLDLLLESLNDGLLSLLIIDDILSLLNSFFFFSNFVLSNGFIGSGFELGIKFSLFLLWRFSDNSCCLLILSCEFSLLLSSNFILLDYLLGGLLGLFDLSWFLFINYLLGNFFFLLLSELGGGLNNSFNFTLSCLCFNCFYWFLFSSGGIFTFSWLFDIFSIGWWLGTGGLLFLFLGSFGFDRCTWRRFN